MLPPFGFSVNKGTSASDPAFGPVPASLSEDPKAHETKSEDDRSPPPAPPTASCGPGDYSREACVANYNAQCETLESI